MKKEHKPVCLIILDGWGHREDQEHNAIGEAKTPFFDSLWKNYPHTLLNASEEHVGLPEGTIGNSEIGHMTIGAGKIIDTDLVRISKAMRAGEFEKNPAFLELFKHVKKHNSTLHILGLVSNGGVHSHQEHLFGLLKTAKKVGIKKIIIHAFTDGRDVPPHSASKFLKELENLIANLGVGFIASVTGRYFAMDRDKNWDRTEKAELAIFKAEGKPHQNTTPSKVLSELYKNEVLDELLEPQIFLNKKGESCKIKKNDGVFFFNFRSDRPRQLCKKIVERAKSNNLFFVTMTEYDPSIKAKVVFAPNKIQATLAGEISKAGLNQSHIAETEKYAHVTYFFNGGKQEPYKNEKQILLVSRRDIKTHDQAPEMRAKEIADKALESLKKNDDFIVLNFANADMVGHTANKKAIIIAVETIDKQLKRVVEKVLKKNGVAIITADHGNAEVNVDAQTGHKHTAHTLNLVPFILVSRLPTTHYPLAATGTLANIAPTILEIMKIKKPSSMTGESLLKKSADS